MASCKTFCVAGAKGGTGKTTVALNLAAVLRDPDSVLLLDADVEEPNAALFLDPIWQGKREIYRKIPVVDESLCNGCGKCADFCAFGAILLLGKTPVIMAESCHACGGCTLACPRGAIQEEDSVLGIVSFGFTETGLHLLSAELLVGNASGVPLVRTEKDTPFSGSIRIIDCPPGTGCTVVEAVRNCDFCILVTEPTLFGLHDLQAAAALLRSMEIPFGVILNRSGLGYDEKIEEYCRKESTPLLGKIPYDRRIAVSYAGGGLPVRDLPEYIPVFEGLWECIREYIR